jgi:hypothetical protein
MVLCSNGGRYLEASVLEPYRQIGDLPVDEIFRLLDEEGCGVKGVMMFYN